MVKLRSDVAQHIDRRRRIDRDAGLGAKLPDLRQRPMQMRQHLRMHSHHRRASRHEGFEIAIRGLDHQVGHRAAPW